QLERALACSCRVLKPVGHIALVRASVEHRGPLLTGKPVGESERSSPLRGSLGMRLGGGRAPGGLRRPAHGRIAVLRFLGVVGEPREVGSLAVPSGGEGGKSAAVQLDPAIWRELVLDREARQLVPKRDMTSACG